MEIPPGLVLGGFEVLGPLGSGGMARVWRGVHAVSGLPVALKVMAAESVRGVSFASFRTELEAAARLHHPRIVRVYEFGSVPEEVAEASKGAFGAGCPFLVMQLAGGGALEAARPPSGWPALASLLRDVLAALAHAHARGVIHRDLKPGNVLHDRGAWLLGDFGLAQAKSDDADEAITQSFASSGTPRYMAPEQFAGAWRDQGPWTDLYALGCLAWLLTCGAPVFDEPSLVELAVAHVSLEPPPLAPRVMVPPGFEGWLRVLLAKKPHDRFACAADARFALDRLEGAAERTIAQPPVLGLLVKTQIDESVRPLPDDWRTEDDALAALPAGAGAGLFGVRVVPLVGREEERDTLWRALREVHRLQRPRALVVRGTAGVGKSRLARWIAERALELGGATVLRAVHSPGGGSHDGVWSAVARHLACQDLERPALRERLAELLAPRGADPRLADALADALAASEGSALVEDIHAKDDERHRLIERLLALLGAERPVVLLLDDVQWGLDALRLTRSLLAAGGALPVLALLTVRDEGLEPGSLEARELDALLPGAEVVLVRELPPDDHRRLVAQLLGLRGDVADHLSRRTEGNPLFALQLVRDWLARGLLVAGEGGFTLRDGVDAPLPPGIHALSRARIDRALAGRAADDRLALELLAHLGAEVDEREWREACKRAGVVAAPELLSDLAQEGLLEPAFGRWRFAHGAVRESVEASARDAGRAQSHHGVIADMLRLERRAGFAELSARIGRHLAGAERLDEALGPLLRAARTWRVQADPQRALAILAERGALLDRLGVAADDARRSEGELCGAWVAYDMSRFDEAAAVAEGVGERARACGFAALGARASVCCAFIAVKQGDLAAAIDLAGAALPTLRQAGDQRGEFEARQAYAEANYYRGDHHVAREAYEENLALAQSIGDDVAAAEAHWGLGYIDLWQGALEAAQGHFEIMRATLLARGSLHRVPSTLNALGEVARLSARYEEAAALYAEALRLLEVYSTTDTLTLHLNLAYTALAVGAPATEAMLVRLLEQVAGARNPMTHAGTLAAVLLLHARGGVTGPALPSWEEALATLDGVLVASGGFDGDIAQHLTSAAAASAAAGRRDRAEAAAALALAQWKALGRHDRVATLEATVKS